LEALQGQMEGWLEEMRVLKEQEQVAVQEAMGKGKLLAEALAARDKSVASLEECQNQVRVCACEGTRDERVRVSPFAPMDMSGLFCTRFLHNRALFQKRRVILRSTSGALKREGDAHEICGRGIVFLVGV
jgi:hypothetical protein